MIIFIFIIILHWIADFIFQEEQWALNKSKKLLPLFKHTLTYSLVWFIPVLFLTGEWINTLWFILIAFITHSVIDYITSRIVSKRFKEGYLGSPIPNFGTFTIIGFDQVLHYIQLILTWYLLFGNFV